VAHDDQFTATGPPFTGSGVPRSAFSTRAAGMVYGANVQGDRAGVYAESVRGGTGREADVPGVGLWGIGDAFGTVGRAAHRDDQPSVAGVLGEHNHGGRGVIGACAQGGIGVFGTTVRSLGNPLGFGGGHTPGDGSGTGVLGASGTGTGVRGTSSASDGVRGESSGGVGLAGESLSGRGGRFRSATESGELVGQINLAPHEMATSRRLRAAPTMFDTGILAFLPAEGLAGDVLVTRDADGASTLWFCAQSSAAGQRADWRQVLLSEPPEDRTLSEATLRFVDWKTRQPDGSLLGSLFDHEVRLTGPLGTAFVLDGSYPGFSGADFSPRLAASDMAEIVAGPGHLFTLHFGAPVRDPTFMLASFGSVLTFTSGGRLVLVSGNDRLTVDGPSVIGHDEAGPSQGTVRVEGVFETVTFAAITNGPDTSIPDGIFFQVGATEP
jgi:hypothetical protein